VTQQRNERQARQEWKYEGGAIPIIRFAQALLAFVATKRSYSSQRESENRPDEHKLVSSSRLFWPLPLSTIMISNLPQSLEVSSKIVFSFLLLFDFRTRCADLFEIISLLVHDIVEYSYSWGGGIRL
jgi:hypothetical protein